MKHISDLTIENKRRPKLAQWMKLTRAMNLKEKIFFFFILLFFFGSLGLTGATYYFSKTEAVSNYGGEYIEGIVGQPLHVNPILSPTNETDADLARLVYSGLLKYNGEGKLVNDLAESYEMSEDKLTYTVRLKQNVLWHDGAPLTTQDVIFTVNLLSDPTYKSPYRTNWQGIETSAPDDHTIQFKIQAPYVGFLNNLTFGILPKHIWGNVTPDNFSLNPLNLKPIGSGPYKYNSVQKDSNDNIISYKLIANPDYFEGKPYISKMTFNFYTEEESALDALNRKEIMGINALSPEKIGGINVQKSILVHKFEIPRYFSVFFNQTKSIPVASDEVREALDLATNRQEIIDKVLYGFGQKVYSPFLPGMCGHSDSIGYSDYDLNKANEILEQNGWVRGEDGFRGKNGIALEINLVTTDCNDLVETADILKSQWEKAGIKTNLNSFSISDIQENHIRPREYEALLFGQVVGSDPDPYSFWHSNQKKDPGLNLSLFDSSEADQLIDNGRVEFDQEKRSQYYVEFQKILQKEMPAIFLYSPNYVYPVNKKVRGIDMKTLISPARRFSEANHWYIKTKRIWK